MMMPMTIAIMSISKRQGRVHANVRVDAPEIGATASIDLEFSPPPGTDAADWREDAYDRALMMLDPE
jgi:hypothetical protein